MEKIKSYLIAGLITVLAIVISVNSCSNQGDELLDNTEQFKSKINEKEKELVAIQNREQSLIQKLKSDSLKNSVALVAYKRENKALRIELKKARVPVQVLIDSIPSLDAFVDLQDSLIHFQEGRIDSLDAQIILQSIRMNGYITLTNQKFAASQEINSHIDALNKDLSKKLKKERHKKSFWKIVSGIAVAVVVYVSVTD